MLPGRGVAVGTARGCSLGLPAPPAPGWEMLGDAGMPGRDLELVGRRVLHWQPRGWGGRVGIFRSCVRKSSKNAAGGAAGAAPPAAGE